jgi:phenylalanine-4-hydroxylase
VLEQFSNSMALRKGGLSSVKKLIDSKSLGTIELSTGVQISGNFSNVIEFDNKPIYIQSTGETALANRDKELIGHGVEYHAEGFGCPIGKLKGINIPIENMSPRDLEAYGIYEGKQTVLEFEGGIKVVGTVITGTRDLQGKIQLISFKECTVTHQDVILFDPSWGIYDMAVGKEVVSVFAGPACVSSFKEVNKVSETKTHKIQYSDSDIKLYSMYKDVRERREEETTTETMVELTFETLKNEYPSDWLLPLELYELSVQNNYSNQTVLLEYLEELKCNKSYTVLIEKGIVLCKN